jgi:hypothetical protein
MNGQPPLCLGGHSLQRAESPLHQQPIADRDRETVAQRIGRQFGRNREQDQDRHADTGLPQLETFIVRGHAQSGDAGDDECPRYRHRTVAVGVGLDHGLDTRAGRKQALQESDVADHRVEVDLQPGSLWQRWKRAPRNRLDERVARGDRVGRRDLGPGNRYLPAPSARRLRASGSSIVRSEASRPASPSRARTASPAIACR